MTATATKSRVRKSAPAVADTEVEEVTAKPVGTCLFSGLPTGSAKSRFLPGHDAKLKSLLLKVTRGDAKLSTVPAPALKILRTGEPLVGFQLDTTTKELSVVGNFAVGAPKAPKAEKTAVIPERRIAKKAVKGSGAGARAARRAQRTEETTSDDE